MMPPENEDTCTCMCTPCAEFAGCAACPDCHRGCDACGYPHPEVDLDTRTVHDLAASMKFPKDFDDLWDRYGAPKPASGGPTGFAAGPVLIDDPGPDDWQCP